MGMNKNAHQHALRAASPTADATDNQLSTAQIAGLVAKFPVPTLNQNTS
jgi:hypothetical protein